MRLSTLVDPDFTATPSRWFQFIEEATCGDAELANYLSVVAGMMLFGEQRNHVMIMMKGIGRNGKSVYLDALREIMGDYAVLGMPGLIDAKRNDSHATEIASLEGARTVIVNELKDVPLDEGKIKRLNGGGNVTANKMHKDPTTFRATWTMITDTNKTPVIVGTDEGIWGRVRLVPFLAHSPDGDPRQDKELPGKLKAEAGAILAWQVRQCVTYLAHGLPDCEIVTSATAHYRADQDVLSEFIELGCEVSPSNDIASSELYDAVVAYLINNGNRKWSKRKVTSEFGRRGIVEPYRSGGARRLRGLSLHPMWKIRLGIAEDPPDGGDYRYGGN